MSGSNRSAISEAAQRYGAALFDFDGTLTTRETFPDFMRYAVARPRLLVGGALLAFIISMDDLVITYFIAGVDSTTLPVFIYGMIRRGIKPEINAIATIFLVLSTILVVIFFDKEI